MKMKTAMITTLITAALTIFSVAQAADDLVMINPLKLNSSKLEIDSGAFWFRKWEMNSPKDINLKTLTSYDSAVLMTFSGADFTYLNQVKATAIKPVSDNKLIWTYQDDLVEYSRTYEAQGDVVTVNVDLNFKQKSPDKAFINLVSKGLADDPESRDRELFYYTNNSVERNLVESSIDSTEVATASKWMGAGSRYFIFAIIPDGVVADKLLIQSTGEKQAQSSYQFPVQNGQFHGRFKVAFAPKNLEILRAVDPTLDTTVNLGFFTFVAYPILWMLKFIYKFVGNYGVAIIILTLIIKILTFPLTLKSVKGMRKMSEFQPRMKALQEKYKDNKEALNREMLAMMKTSGYNPMAGCFPMLIQMPVFFALYSVLYAAVELYQAPFAFWIQDLSAKDPYFITPILMTVTMFFQQKLTPPAPGMDPTQQKVMQWMPVMFGAFMVTTPSGLCLYMLVNAIASALQQLYLNKKLGVPGYAAGIASSL
jgi:YidC/Oxa1 family membrane protein insertase